MKAGDVVSGEGSIGEQCMVKVGKEVYPGKIAGRGECC